MVCSQSSGRIFHTDERSFDQTVFIFIHNNSVRFLLIRFQPNFNIYFVGAHYTFTPKFKEVCVASFCAILLTDKETNETNNPTDNITFSNSAGEGKNMKMGVCTDDANQESCISEKLTKGSLQMLQTPSLPVNRDAMWTGVIKVNSNVLFQVKSVRS